MAKYKVVDVEKLDAALSSVANTIRTKGGTTESLPFPQGFVDSVGAIKTGGGTEEIEQIIDESGVLDSIDETVTVTEKVEQLIDKANVKGIIFSDFTGGVGFPKKADMRSIDIPEQEITENTDTTFSYLFANTSSRGFYCYLEEIYLPERIHTFSSYMFQHCYNLTTLHGDITKVKSVIDYAFNGCKKLTKFPYMPSLLVLKRSAFNGCTGLTEVKIYNKLTECAAAAFYNCPNIKDIYVPWAEGEVANAPWGATNATIHYNTTYDENRNPIVTEV